MGILDVGIENLPNVYITKIRLAGTQVSVECLIKDHKENKSWRGRAELEQLKVKCVLVHDGDGKVNEYNAKILGLNSGTESLFDYTQDDETCFMLQHNASSFNKRLTNESQNSDEDFYYGNFIFTLPSNYFGVGFMTVYVACFLDGLSFENNMFNKYYGPMASELVKELGLVNTVSGYFYNPETNEEYGGPVHLHPDKGYMVGSRHSSKPHAALRFVQETNSKIIEE